MRMLSILAIPHSFEKCYNSSLNEPFTLAITYTTMRLILLCTAMLLVSARPGKDIPVYTSFEDFAPLLHQDNDTTYVVNFWATWCKPCIAELPYFDQLAAEYKDEKLKVILVSMDFADQLNSRLKPFIQKKNVASKVVVFDAPKPNQWIPKINEDWSGAIPATYIYRGKEQQFYERSFEYEDLKNVVTPFLKK